MILNPWAQVRKLRAENRDLRDAKADLATALRLTVEYTQLPCVPGWSWYDTLQRVDPELLEAMKRHSMAWRSA